MKNVFSVAIAFIIHLYVTSLFAAPYVTNVVAKQRCPWGIVDISCEVCAQCLLELISKEISMRKHFSDILHSKNDLKLSVKCFMSNED